MDHEVRRWLNDLQAGRNVTVGEVTLGASPATSTAVSCQGCSSGSVVTFMPMDVDAASALATMYCTPGKQQFIIAHAATATPGRFRYVVHTNTRPL